MMANCHSRPDRESRKINAGFPLSLADPSSARAQAGRLAKSSSMKTGARQAQPLRERNSFLFIIPVTDFPSKNIKGRPPPLKLRRDSP